MKQATLPLEIVSKGRFDKSEPTIHKGEDLDVPTYIRRGRGAELSWNAACSRPHLTGRRS